MKVNGIETTKQDEEDYKNLREVLTKVMQGNSENVKLMVTASSLSDFLLVVSVTTEPYGIGKDKFTDLVMNNAKRPNKLKEQKRDKQDKTTYKSKTMEANNKEFIMQELKDSNKLYLNLTRVFDDNDLAMRLPVFMTSLAYFLSEMSERVVKYGINKDDLIDGLATAIKNANELKDRKKTSKAMDASKVNNGCKSQNDNEMQSTGFDISAKDLTERGKFVFSSYKTTDGKVEIEITNNAINIQTGNVSMKMPRHSIQDVNLINQQVTLKRESCKEAVRKLYIEECDLDASQDSQQQRKDGRLDNINDY